MARQWTRARQVELERPTEPLSAHCSAHRPLRTTIRVQFGWWCLACDGCPRCRAQQVWEQVEVDDGGLAADPLRLDGRPVRGDWWCLRCGEWLVRWAEYRRALRSWLAGRRAIAEGYKRREEEAA